MIDSNLWPTRVKLKKNIMTNIGVLLIKTKFEIISNNCNKLMDQKFILVS